MTVRFGMNVIDYRQDGMVRNEDGSFDYQYSPVQDVHWYSAEAILDLEVHEFHQLKVMV